jgi:hypothetical protein
MRPIPQRTFHEPRISPNESVVETAFAGCSPQQPSGAQPQLSLSFITTNLLTANYFVANAALFRCRDFIQKCPEVPYSFVIQRVVRPFASFTPVYKHTIAKAFHMVGKRRLRNIELLQNHTGAQLAAGEHIHDHQPVWVR